jgi:hypothetical protein
MAWFPPAFRPELYREGHAVDPESASFPLGVPQVWQAVGLVTAIEGASWDEVADEDTPATQADQTPMWRHFDAGPQKRRPDLETYRLYRSQGRSSPYNGSTTGQNMLRQDRQSARDYRGGDHGGWFGSAHRWKPAASVRVDEDGRPAVRCGRREQNQRRRVRTGSERLSLRLA